MTTKLVLFDGELGQRYPEGIRVNAVSAFEALNGLRLHPGFMPGKDRLMRVKLLDFRSPSAMRCPTSEEVIRVSVIGEGSQVVGAGGKVGSIFAVVIGVLLIVFAPYLAPILGVSTTAIGYAGLLMAAQGIQGLLAKKPDSTSNTSSSERSNLFSATGNTVKSGTAIPLVLGRSIVYGHILSYQVTAAEKGTNITVPPAEIQGGQFLAGNDNFELTQEEWS